MFGLFGNSLPPVVNLVGTLYWQISAGRFTHLTASLCNWQEMSLAGYKSTKRSWSSVTTWSDGRSKRFGRRSCRSLPPRPIKWLCIPPPWKQKKVFLSLILFLFYFFIFFGCFLTCLNFFVHGFFFTSNDFFTRRGACLKGSLFDICWKPFDRQNRPFH